jgi:hypothetical protein
MARHTSRASSPARRLNRHVERNVGAAVRTSKRPTDAQRETVYAGEVGGRRIEIAAAFLKSHFSAFRRYCEIQPFENRVSTDSPSSAGAPQVNLAGHGQRIESTMSDQMPQR